jgi:hypothetical protein
MDLPALPARSHARAPSGRCKRASGSCPRRQAQEPKVRTPALTGVAERQQGENRDGGKEDGLHFWWAKGGVCAEPWAEFTSNLLKTGKYTSIYQFLVATSK